MSLPAPDPAPDVLAVALDDAGRGWRVFPVKSEGKEPLGRLVRRGHLDASTDPAKIRAWWSAAPEANVGVVCGPSSFDVLDVDGDEGERRLATLEKRFGPLPVTREHSTGRGRHILFAPSGFPCSNGALGSKLDTKGKGGYVVAPPSLHASGKRYTVARDVPLAPAPAWLVALLRGEDPLAVAEAAVAGAPEGRRNTTLNGLAFDQTMNAASPAEAKEATARLVARSSLSKAEAERVGRNALRDGLEVAQRRRERFRRVPVVLMLDPRFRHRSAHAKLVALYVCTGPDSTAIPGVAVSSLPALARSASLSTKATQRAIRELSKRGLLRSDVRAGVFWLPSVTSVFRPESPNVARAWTNALAHGIPRCALAREIALAVSGQSGAQTAAPIKRALKSVVHKEEGSPTSPASPRLPPPEASLGGSST